MSIEYILTFVVFCIGSFGLSNLYLYLIKPQLGEILISSMQLLTGLITELIIIMMYILQQVMALLLTTYC